MLLVGWMLGNVLGCSSIKINKNIEIFVLKILKKYKN